jgi:ABC-type multidrug transport system ATPase subunit
MTISRVGSSYSLSLGYLKSHLNYKSSAFQRCFLVGLSQSATRKKQMRQYSKGMLQRVGMAQALISDPEVVFFDEPMSGIDPMGRYQTREIILSLKAQGKIIFFNSHVLLNVEKICGNPKQSIHLQTQKTHG